jgi:general stress protein 26
MQIDHDRGFRFVAASGNADIGLGENFYELFALLSQKPDQPKLEFFWQQMSVDYFQQEVNAPVLSCSNFLQSAINYYIIS